MNHKDKLTNVQRQHIAFNERRVMRYACPCIFGSPPHKGGKINNGTVTLIEHDSKRYVVTNFHVIKYFREQVKIDKDTFFCIGSVYVDPEDIIIATNELFDLVVMDVTYFDKNKFKPYGNVPTEFFILNNFDFPPIKEGDFLMFGGYPGELKEQPERDELHFYTLSSGGSLINTVSSEVISASINLSECIKTSIHGKEFPSDLGGISGCPAFFEYKSSGGIMLCNLIGIVYQYSSPWDSLLIRPIHLLKDLIK